MKTLITLSLLLLGLSLVAARHEEFSIESLIKAADSTANTLESYDDGNLRIPEYPTTGKPLNKKATPEQAAAAAPASKKKKDWVVSNPVLTHPLVDRPKKRSKLTRVAILDGAGAKRAFKKHTAKDKAKARADNAARRHKRRKSKKPKITFNGADYFEDERTKIVRLQKRMTRLVEKMGESHAEEPLEIAVSRKHYYLQLYHKFKREAAKLMENFALRTGSSILGNEPLDPVLKAYLPPDSLAAILDQYAQPSNVREREHEKDVISYTDAERLRFKMDAYRANKMGIPVPLDPFRLPRKNQIPATTPEYHHQNPYDNSILARQQGRWGNGRPLVTTGSVHHGKKGTVGDIHVHLVDDIKVPIVSNMEDNNARALPINLIPGTPAAGLPFPAAPQRP